MPTGQKQNSSHLDRQLLSDAVAPADGLPPQGRVEARSEEDHTAGRSQIQPDRPDPQGDHQHVLRMSNRGPSACCCWNGCGWYPL